MNQLNKQYPCFLETYGYYMYKKDKYWKRLQKDKPVTDISVLKKGLTFLKDIDFYKACKSSQQIAILIQHLKNIQSLDDVSREPDFIQNELMGILYQLYAPLGKLKNNFTHYDLHLNNIYIYEPVTGSYIEYHYYDGPSSIVSFKSSYMLKIIDYGRSYFKDDLNRTDSKHIYETQLCPEDECNEPEDERGTCGSRVGFIWMEELSKTEPEKQFYISSQQRNMSHDLLPLNRIKENNTAPNINQLTPELNTLVNKVVYKDYFGTPEKTSESKTKIGNVSDAAFFIRKYLMNSEFQRKNEEVNAGKTKLGDLHVYMDGRPMLFVPI
jgi:hypothetical protein